jgi:hypothetical protein
MTLDKNTPSIDCAAFQEKLPEMFASGADSINGDPVLMEHLKTCENCSALVRDLQYIADQARQLLQPTHEPSDSLWDKIQREMAADPIPADAENL